MNRGFLAQPGPAEKTHVLRYIDYCITNNERITELYRHDFGRDALFSKEQAQHQNKETDLSLE